MLYNQSLLSKWLWRYNQEEHALWKEVIQHKFSQEGEWCSDEVTTTYGVGVWRTIRSFWLTVEVNTKLKLGGGVRFYSGKKTRLVKDLFKVCFLDSSKISEIWSQQGWNLVFRRLLNDWEIEGVIELLNMIEGFPSTNLETDSLLWIQHPDGRFSVDIWYKWVLSVTGGRKTGPWSAVWKSVAPTKVKCFVWLVARRAYLTHEALQKRGINIASRCLLCKEALETNKHLFLHCKVTTQGGQQESKEVVEDSTCVYLVEYLEGIRGFLKEKNAQYRRLNGK
ncbi:hypothetical protein MTR67_047367 [Solanum verrucosum]|uniref:Reverse transcriptase zinc-binding domain-containing protein n=1 Tax=Solanum verrucosum TaxID=315347 RepID=A0AAF0UWZ4_SOLVR|nr:hypothetical protein MTR67_047367 [Solanum verrucosum]